MFALYDKGRAGETVRVPLVTKSGGFGGIFPGFWEGSGLQ